MAVLKHRPDLEKAHGGSSVFYGKMIQVICAIMQSFEKLLASYLEGFAQGSQLFTGS